MAAGVEAEIAALLVCVGIEDAPGLGVVPASEETRLQPNTIKLVNTRKEINRFTSPGLAFMLGYLSLAL